MNHTGVLIIGGGISGLAVARELSRYQVDTVLVEREADVGWGQTKACYAIRHPGVRWPQGSTAQRMIVQGNRWMTPLLKELDIEYNPVGELVLAFNREERAALERMKRTGDRLQIKGMEIIGPQEIRRLEPLVNPSVSAALSMPSAGIFNPFDLVVAFFENARDNGVRMMMETEVLAIEPGSRGFTVKTSRGDIRADFVVNAAGLLADRIARMAGSADFKIVSNTKGSCLVVDTHLGQAVRHIVTGFHDPDNLLRYKLITPTFHDKLLLYTSFPEPAADIEDRSVAPGVFQRTIRDARDLLPGVNFEAHVIAAFSSVAARNDWNDFIVAASGQYERLIHVAPTPPGLTASPAVARRVLALLGKSGLAFSEKTDFTSGRRRISTWRRSPPEAMDRLLNQDARYGRVVCRCETVSEGEIVQAVKRGATTLDGVKFRTCASMGRCQSNYCGPELIKILSRELGRPVGAITKKGRGSSYTGYTS